ncbi:MAG: response regulator [Desulfobacteraceae bacterium]|nr:response regulator [Desulfobacteraceae bacterium]
MENVSSKPKILIVDDTPENIIAFEMLVKKLDVDIVTANSGEEALAATLYDDFSLILLDVMMPGMNGYEVAELLQKDDRTSGIPIIFVTAMDKSDAQEIKGYTRGAVDFIFKPINEIVLTCKIKVHLELYRMKKFIEMIMLKQQTENPKILIVDDTPENLFVLEKVLGKLDADIIKAASGNEALSSILYNNFALIILDVQMPEMNGYEVAEILKSDDRTENIPIIFVTAIDRDVVKEIKGYSKGAVDFIFKPLNEFILISKVKIFLEIHKIKTGLESMVLARTRELEKNNKELRAQIQRNERTAKELVNARSYLSNVINSISSSMAGVDSQANIIDMNIEAQKSSGFSSEAAKGRPIKEIFPCYGELTKYILLSMEKGEPIEKNRIKVYFNDTLLIKNFSICPLIGNGIRGAVVRIDDVTEKARIDEMMIQSEKMLSIGGLAAGMAHEINNPLAGIIQNIQVVKNRIKKDLPKNRAVAQECGITHGALKTYMEKRDIFRMIDSIMECGELAVQIVENMLSFSQKSVGRATKEDIRELMDKTLELAKNEYDLKKSFDFRQIEIQRQYEQDLPDISCQRSKIQQVILNLLINGAHALAENREADKNISRFILSIRSDKGMVCMEIEDNGAGMEEAVRKRVFEPFFTTKQTGTGLGLSIAYFIITEEHGGTMEVESSLGKGTKFIIRLPV